MICNVHIYDSSLCMLLVYNIFKGLQLTEITSVVAVCGWVVLSDNPNLQAADWPQSEGCFKITAAAVNTIMQDKKKKALFWQQWQAIAKNFL